MPPELFPLFTAHRKCKNSAVNSTAWPCDEEGHDAAAFFLASAHHTHDTRPAPSLHCLVMFSFLDKVPVLLLTAANSFKTLTWAMFWFQIRRCRRIAQMQQQWHGTRLRNAALDRGVRKRETLQEAAVQGNQAFLPDPHERSHANSPHFHDASTFSLPLC